MKATHPGCMGGRSGSAVPSCFLLHPLRQRLSGDQCKTIHAAKRHAVRKQYQLSELGFAGACYPGNKDKDGWAHTKHCRHAELKLGITIFKRTSRGISPIDEGPEAMSYARQIFDQADLMLSRFTEGGESEVRYAVSSQHYEVVVEALATCSMPTPNVPAISP